MKNWEYRAVRIADERGQSRTEATYTNICNTQGSFGWEMVSVVRDNQGCLCFFKRPSQKDHNAVMEGMKGDALSLTLAEALWAKSETARVTISGNDLSQPIEITDGSTLKTFNLYNGPGSSINDVPDLHTGIGIWFQGIVADPPKGLHQYEVLFYGRLPDKKVMYAVTYQYDPSTQKGYIYLPGRGDKWYETNIATICRGVEGNWFQASEDLVKIVQPLISRAKSTRGR